jgi:hypothetical protein
MWDSLMDWFGGDGGATSATPPGSGVQRWSGTVLDALKRVGQPASLADITLRRMQQESGGNPRAINNWEINAKNGTSSKGLMPVIQPTFAANRDRGLVNDIYDPLANIVASMKHTLKRYGSLPAGYNRKGGYAHGGLVFDDGRLATGIGVLPKNTVKPSPRQTDAFESWIKAGADGHGPAPVVGGDLVVNVGNGAN